RVYAIRRSVEGACRVRFIQAITLAQELLQAHQEYRLPKYLKAWQSVNLVIADELGYLGLGPGGPLLFQFCADRYERGSLFDNQQPRVLALWSWPW
ncbi:MAG: ATP-binding protein, partial [Bacillota bacterium]